jgi:prepilin-type processing-associated H-X9-DG protein
VPSRALTAAEAGPFLAAGCRSDRTAKLLQRVSRLTGIEKRHLAALECVGEAARDRCLYLPAVLQPNGPGMSARTAAFDLAAGPLVQQAMRSFSPESLAKVTQVVTASCTHASSPGLEMPVLTHSSIPRDVHRWNLGFMGCSAGLAGLRLVHRMHEATSLIVACELSSLHFQYTDELDQMTANVLFADGAAAVLTSPRPSPVRVLACQCATLPQFADQMVWFAGDHGLQLRLSQKLPETLATHLRPAVSTFLRAAATSRLASSPMRAGGMVLDEVDHWLVHPGGPQILDAVESSLGLKAGALALSRETLRQFGNMSSPTIFFILKSFIESRQTGRVAALAFGPGLTIEMALLEVGSA